MSDRTAYPLSWPVGWRRTSSPTWTRLGLDKHGNRKSFEQSRVFLTKELRMLDAREVVLSTNIELRLDGYPYSGRKQPQDKGVAVYFKLSDVDQVLACDRWDKVESNVWAIAAHIAALRGQERWGVGTIAQAFTGYRALPERSETAGPTSYEVLGVDPLAGEAEIQSAFRQKAQSAHPDKGGCDVVMAQLVRARDDALQQVRT